VSLPKTASDRVRLVLAVLSWMTDRAETTLAELAEQFGLDGDDVIRVIEMVSCCGVPPYSPDALLDIYLDGDRVKANLGRFLRGSHILSAPEGFVLAAAARAMLANQLDTPLPEGTSALDRALQKLERVMGERNFVSVELDPPLFISEVRAALERREQIEIDYYSVSSDKVSRRVIEPFAIFSEGGHFYVDAYCHQVGEVRHFRADRIRSVRSLGVPFESVAGETAEPPVAKGRYRLFEGDESAKARSAVVDMPAEARWAIDGVEVRRVDEYEKEGAKRLEVEVAVFSVPWFERLLLTIGPGARVVDPPEWADLGAEAARKVLRRYRR
jgi:proteasome accessory factor C